MRRFNRIKNPTNPLEHDIQRDFFQWVRIKANADPRFSMIYSIPNGGYRSRKTAIDMKAEGAKAGVFDVAMDFPSGQFHGLKLEFKRLKGGRLSPAQQTYMQLATEYGYKCVIVKSVAEAIKAVEDYLLVDDALKTIGGNNDKI